MASGVTRYDPGDLMAVPAMRKDGTRISVEFSIVFVHDAQGVVAGMVAILRDVCQRHEETRALRRQLAEWRTGDKSST